MGLGIYEWVLHNPIIKFIYRCKEYFNIAVTQISWLSGKLPEVMSILYIGEYIGISIPKTVAGTFILVAFILIIFTGYMIKRMGLFDQDQITVASINPVTDAQYRMALHYLKEHNIEIKR